MDKALADLIKISNLAGRDKTLVQGGGGNTSAKTADGKYMYIKASGTALKDMDAKKAGGGCGSMPFCRLYRINHLQALTSTREKRKWLIVFF